MVDSADDSPGRVLLVGATGLERRLAGAIAGATAGAPGSPTASGHTPWRLDTKYYTADALLEAAHVDASATPASTRLAGYEALVLVFDAGAQASFAAVQGWYEAAGGPDADLGARLAIGLLPAPGSAGGGGGSGGGGIRTSERAAWLEAAAEWCVEQMVELVEAPAAEHAAAQAQPRAAAPAASSREEATGLRRVREALEAHMWPGMQLKPSPRLGAAAAAAAGGDAAEPAERQQAANGAEAPVVEDAVPHTNGAVLSFADFLQAPAAGAVGTAGSGDEEGTDEQMLERVFSQLASHRAQLAQLPDEQRREAAAGMVMQLMAAMGLEEDDEDDLIDE